MTFTDVKGVERQVGTEATEANIVRGNLDALGEGKLNDSFPFHFRLR